MDPALTIGCQATHQTLVTEAMRPVFDGKVIHDVCSTWSIGECMENAARRVLVPYLEPHEEGVGTHLSIDHKGPARLGETMTATATATDVDARQLVCEIIVTAADRVVATGRQVQRVLPRDMLQARLSGT